MFTEEQEKIELKRRYEEKVKILEEEIEMLSGRPRAENKLSEQDTALVCFFFQIIYKFDVYFIV